MIFKDFELKKSASSPYHSQIHDYLLEKINNNELKALQKLPNEEMLSKVFGVSRITIRAALKELELKGEIMRTKGIGTVIKEKNRQSAGNETMHRKNPEYRIVSFMQDRVGQISQEEWKPVLRPANREHKIAYASLAKGYWWYHNLVEQSMVSAAESMGCKAFILNNNLNRETAIENVKIVIELFRKSEIDFFLNAQFYTETNNQISAMLEEARLPSCSVDIAFPNFPYFHVDDYKGNFLAGEWLGNYAVNNRWNISKMRFVYFDQMGTKELSILRRKGAIDGIKSITGIKEGNIDIIKLKLGKLENSRKMMLKWLDRHPDCHNIAIAGSHTYPTLGALYALRKTGRESEAAICGLGGSREELVEICRPESAYKAVASTFPEKYGTIAIPFAVDYLEGLPVPADIKGYTLIITKNNIGRFYPEFSLK